MNNVVVGILSRKREDGEVEYLLVKSKQDFGEYTGCYYPPGGHIEDGENPADALAREIQEELGLTANPIKEITVAPGDIKDQETHWWACEVMSGELHIQQEEIADARYFTKQEMEKLRLFPATQKFFNEYVFKAQS